MFTLAVCHFLLSFEIPFAVVTLEVVFGQCRRRVGNRIDTIACICTRDAGDGLRHDAIGAVR